MQEHLVHAPETEVISLAGPHLLIATERVEIAGYRGVLDFASAIQRRIPEVAYQLRPGPPAS